MGKVRVLLIIALPVLLLAQQSPLAPDVVLNHVTLIDVATSAVRRDMAIVIRGNRIAAVNRANAIEIERNARVVDLTGKFAIPGLVDMHNHVGTGADMPGPPIPGEESSRAMRQNLTQMLASGFTTVFSTAHSDLREVADLRSASNVDGAAISRYFSVGRATSVVGGHASQPRFGNYLPSGPEEARTNVRELKATGVDGVKFIYSDQSHTGRPSVPVLSPEIMRAMIDEAHAVGLKAYVHAPTLRHAKEVLRAGADALVHSVADAPVDDEFIALMRKNSASYTTTLSLYTALADISAWMRRLEAIDERKLVPKEVYERYRSFDGAKIYHDFFGTFPPEHLRFARANVRRIFDAGIPVLAGTDTAVTGVLLGVSSQMELVLLVEAGLKPAEALRTATLNAARALDRERDLGSVESGKLADVVILDADPLNDIRNVTKIHRVVKGGIVYEPAQLLVRR